MTKLKLTIFGLLVSASLMIILYLCLQWANRIEQQYQERRAIDEGHAVEVSG